MNLKYNFHVICKFLSLFTVHSFSANYTVDSQFSCVLSSIDAFVLVVRVALEVNNIVTNKTVVGKFFIMTDLTSKDPASRKTI